jgi:hypothetical protein
VKTGRAILAGIVLAVIATLGVWFVGRRSIADVPDVSGTWTLVSFKDGTDTSRALPTGTTMTYAFDTQAQEMTVTVLFEGAETNSFVVPYTIDGEDHMVFGQAGTQDLVMSPSVDGDTLTLSYVAHTGDEAGESTDAPAPHPSNQTGSTDSGFAGPPLEVTLTR